MGGVAKPTGAYTEQMLDAGGWPEVDEETYRDRAQRYTLVLRQVTGILETSQRQAGEIFDGGIWSGAAAGAANGELGGSIDGLVTLQNGLATVITWHRYIAGTIEQAKSDISDNVDGAHKQINALETDSSLDATARTTAINMVLSATYGANLSIVDSTAEQILASKAWKPPNNSLKDLLDQKLPPPLTLPDTSSPVSPLPVSPSPVEQTDPLPRPVQPAPVTPAPVLPERPVQPPPVAPAAGVIPQPTPGTPSVPGQSPRPPGPTPGAPSPTPTVPDAPGAAPALPLSPAAPLGPAALAAPLSPAASAQPQDTDGRGKGMAPASASGASPSLAPPSEDASAAVAPAAATGMPVGPMASGASGGTGAGLGARSGAPVGQKPTDKQPSTRPAAARVAERAKPAARPASTDHTETAEVVAIAPIIPVSAARAERDAIADAATADAARRSGPDPLQLARRIAAALNAPGSGGEGDLGFFWVTAVTTEGTIVVANSYGLAYIPDRVHLPEQVHMASADDAIPAAERASWATYPVMAVQGWANHRNTKLRAVIATEKQLANSDAGAVKIVLQPDDIPASGDMVGRSRLDVVDADAAERLAATTDPRLIDLVPPAPTDANPRAGKRPPFEVMDPEQAAQLANGLAAGASPEQLLAAVPSPPVDASPSTDQRPMLWFDVMKPLASKASGRQAAHLRAFHTYAAHAQELVLKEVYTAVDPIDQRSAVADWLYWKHLSGLLDTALAGASRAQDLEPKT
jgi:hypothetical protein